MDEDEEKTEEWLSSVQSCYAVCDMVLVGSWDGPSTLASRWGRVMVCFYQYPDLILVS
jgi:hypothetical protein